MLKSSLSLSSVFKNLRPSYLWASIRSFNDRSEASYNRRIYCNDGKIEFGSPTFTFFTEAVCLTMKMRHEDNLGQKVMLFTGMTRAKGESKIFEKKSRVSSVLPLDEAMKLEGLLETDAVTPTTLHGLDGGNIIFSRSGDSISLKLCPSLIPGLDITNMSVGSLGSSKIHVNFVGGRNEHSLLLYALKEFKPYHQ